MAIKDLTVILPTLNEEKNVLKIIYEIKKIDKKVQIIVSDDGSKDKTKNEVQRLQKKFSGIYFLDRKGENTKGLTASVIDGILQTKTKYFIVMDSDLQHPPEKIVEMAKQLKDFDVVIGTREKITANWSIKRRIISKAATILGKTKLFFSGKNSEDVLSGFFGAKTDFFKETLNKNENRFVMEGFKILFDFLKCLPKKINVSKVYYEFGLREHGESKIGKKHVFLFLKSVFK